MYGFIFFMDLLFIENFKRCIFFPTLPYFTFPDLNSYNSSWQQFTEIFGLDHFVITSASDGENMSAI